MSSLKISDIPAYFKENVGKEVAKCYTQHGPGNWMNTEQTAVGRILRHGGVSIGGDGESDSNAFDWMTQPTKKSSTPHGPDENYSAATQLTFGKATLGFKRRHVTSRYDNITAGSRVSSGRVSQHIVDKNIEEDLRAVSEGLESDFFGDGTAVSGKVLTGALAALSAANTYAGINQNVDTYWQAALLDANGQAASEPLLDVLMLALQARGAIDSSSEIWVPSPQYGVLQDAYKDSVRLSRGELVGSPVPHYDRFGMNVPIRMMIGMPSDEIWVLKMNEVKMKFFDGQNASLAKYDNNRGAVENWQGMPIHIIPQNPTGQDNVKFVTQAHAQYAIRNPRNTGRLYNLLT